MAVMGILQSGTSGCWRRRLKAAARESCSDVAKDGIVDLGNAGTLITLENIVVFPEPDSLIQLEIDTSGLPLPTSKNKVDLPVILSFTAGGVTLKTYGEIKVQGSSTAGWPKKTGLKIL